MDQRCYHSWLTSLFHEEASVSVPGLTGLGMGRWASVNTCLLVEGDGCPTSGYQASFSSLRVQSDQKCYVILLGNYLSISCVSILY